jgi:hypothetical protein
MESTIPERRFQDCSRLRRRAELLVMPDVMLLSLLIEIQI